MESKFLKIVIVVGKEEAQVSKEGIKVSFEKSGDTQVPFSEVDISEFFKVDVVEGGYYVVTEKNWREYFTEIKESAGLMKNIYIGVSLGQRPTGGYLVDIVDINQEKDEVYVTLEITEPEPSQFVIQVITNPHQFVSVNKPDFRQTGELNFIFVDKKLNQLKKISVPVD